MKKPLLLLFSFLFASSVFANEIGALKKSLGKSAHSDYFPLNAEYRLFRDVCNAARCFDVVFVSYTTDSNKGMRRLAVFTQSGVYLGVYSGFFTLPISASGNVIQFTKSEYGDQI